MALFKKIEQVVGDYRIEIYIEGASGPVLGLDVVGEIETVTGKRINDANGYLSGIYGSQLRFNIVDDAKAVYDLLRSNDANAQIRLRRVSSSIDLFYGVILNSALEFGLQFSRQEFTIVATDGLALLKSRIWNETGTFTFAELFRELLNATGYELDYANFFMNWKETNASGTLLPTLIRFNASTFTGMTYFEILEELSNAFLLQIFQSDFSSTSLTRWIIYQTDTRDTTSTTYYRMEMDTGTVTSILTTNSLTLTDAKLIIDSKLGNILPISRGTIESEVVSVEPIFLNTGFSEYASSTFTNWTQVGTWTQSGSALTALARSTTNGNTLTQQSRSAITSDSLSAEGALKLRIKLGAQIVASVTGLDGAYDVEYATVKFIDPAGIADDLYLTDAGGLTTTPTNLTYTQAILDPGSAGQLITQDITITLATATTVPFTGNRIFEVELISALVGDAGAGDVTIYQYMEFDSVTVSNYILPTVKGIIYSVDNAVSGSTYEKEVAITNGEAFGMISQVEYFDGTDWEKANDWQTGTDNLAKNVLKKVSSLAQKRLEYYIFSVRLSENPSMVKTIAYDSKKFVPVQILRKFDSGFVILQAIEKRTDTANSILERQVL